MHARERRYAARDNNRIVRPFEWGASFVKADANGDDPRRILGEHTRVIARDSETFFNLPPIADYQLTNDTLTWTSAVRTLSQENDMARARFFPAPNKKEAGSKRRAVLILPQWNADAESHVALCRVLNRLGIAALRLTLPYHEERRPPELERADFLVSSNIGRTIQSMRQAVLDVRAAAYWLRHRGYNRIGIVGTSIGSCTSFLAFVHDEAIDVGVFNHVSGYFADVVWHGISTQHVRAGFKDEVTLEELREYWLPISPLFYIERLARLKPRPMRFIAARYDLTFPPKLSRNVIAAVQSRNVPLDVTWLSCGHYTLGEKPWVYLDGWKIAAFLKKHL
jgi:dienelactone hydrolase